jgi:ABC-2 type transport system ATP-binding protein
MLATASRSVPAAFEAPPDAVISVRDLTKVYPGGVEAIKGISFFVREGEFFGLLGPNGAGKSTAIKILITLLARTSGQATVVGHDVASESTTVRRLIGYSAPEASLDADLTGRENLSFQGGLYHMDCVTIRQRSEELIALLDLVKAADRNVGTYSGGMQKRVDLACALIHRPRVLFLDEPTSGLDPHNRAALWRYLKSLNKDEGLTIFLTTHYMEEADSLCDRLAIVDDGRICAEGSPASLKSSLGGDVISLVFNDTDRRLAQDEVLRAREIANTQPFVRSATVGLDGTAVNLTTVVANGAESLPALLRLLDESRLNVSKATLTSPTLDDVFLKYTGQGTRQDDRLL